MLALGTTCSAGAAVASTDSTTARPLASTGQAPFDRSVMSEYYQAYGTVLAMIAAGVALVAVAFTLSRFVAPSKVYGGKLSTYECGLDPVGQGWSQTHIRYYLFAFMFVVFDVETLFVFPWAVFLGGAPAETQGFM